MQPLIEGVHRFQRETFGNSRELLENLPTHLCVQERLNRGALHLHGWFFKTATGELFAYDPATGQFEPLMAFGAGRHT